MAKTSGFGICVNNKDLKKAMSALSIDYGLEIVDMQTYFDQLIEVGILIIISDSAGNQYATTIQQVFNWEYKMWTRWTNNQYQKKKRGEAASKNELTEQGNFTLSTDDDTDDILLF